MNAVCVDGDKLSADNLVSLCRALPPLTGAEGFARGSDALAWLAEHDAALALLETELPDMNGLDLAAEIRKIRPDTAIIFVTGSSGYAVGAFRLRVSGYLLKPVGRERLAEEVNCALSGRRPEPRARVLARTFGPFDFLVDGKSVPFRQARCRELLAYLVDRHGGGVTRAEAFSVLWEDRVYDRPMQKQFDAVLRSLRRTLEECGAGGILEVRNGCLRVRPEWISCDAWRFFSGDPEAAGAFRGEYMKGYAWGAETESFMNRKHGNEPRQILF